MVKMHVTHMCTVNTHITHVYVSKETTWFSNSKIQRFALQNLSNSHFCKIVYFYVNLRNILISLYYQVLLCRMIDRTYASVWRLFICFPASQT